MPAVGGDRRDRAARVGVDQSAYGLRADKRLVDECNDHRVEGGVGNRVEPAPKRAPHPFGPVLGEDDLRPWERRGSDDVGRGCSEHHEDRCAAAICE